MRNELHFRETPFANLRSGGNGGVGGGGGQGGSGGGEGGGGKK